MAWYRHTQESDQVEAAHQQLWVGDDSQGRLFHGPCAGRWREKMAVDQKKLNIKEANEHLQALHKRVFELENQVQTHVLHISELEKVNAVMERGLAEKEREMDRLTSELAAARTELARLQASGGEVESWKRKADAFDRIMEHKQAIESIVHHLHHCS